MSYPYAERTSDHWYILSAKYGLVFPDDIIAPYDMSLNHMEINQRKAWAVDVFKKLETFLKPEDKVIILAGKRYREHLIPKITQLGIEVSVPMRNLKIGQQLHWLKQHLRQGG